MTNEINKYDTKWLQVALGLVEATEIREPIPLVDWVGALQEKARVKTEDYEKAQRKLKQHVADKEAVQTRDVYMAQTAWNDFWENHLSTLVRETAAIPGGSTSSTTASTAGSAVSRPIDSPGVNYWEIAEKKYDYEPYPYGLIRAMRRVFTRFNLEAFVEDRTFPDYRNHLDQEWQALFEEAKDFSLRANKAREILGALFAKFESGSATEAAEEVKKMIDAVRKTDAQIEVVATLNDSGFKASIFEKLRILHTAVQSAWGTWVRRVKVPSLWFLGFGCLAILLHALLGSIVPTDFSLFIWVVLPFLAFALNFYSGRGRQDKRICKTVALLAIFHPEPAAKLSGFKDRIVLAKFAMKAVLAIFRRERSSNPTRITAKLRQAKSAIADIFRPEKPADVTRTRDQLTLVNYQPSKPEVGVAARRYTLWYPKFLGRPDDATYQEQLEHMGNRAYSRVTGGDDSRTYEEIAFEPNNVKVSSKRWTASLYTILVVILFLVGWVLYQGSQSKWPPRFEVEGKVSDGTCVIATGQIVWPGPWEVIVRDPSGSGFTVIPFGQVARIAPVPHAGPQQQARSNESDAASRRSGKGVSCLSAAASSATGPAVLTTVVNVSASGTSHKGVLVIPFPQDETNKIPCSGPIADHTGAKVNKILEGVLRNVSNALKACGASGGGMPTIDVRGFASSLDFDPACKIVSDARNHALAEARRTSVLNALKSDTGAFKFQKSEKTGGVWEAPFAVLEPRSENRWATLQHMRDALVVRDKVNGQSASAREALSRHAEIWFLDLAGCDTFNAPSGIR